MLVLKLLMKYLYVFAGASTCKAPDSAPCGRVKIKYDADKANLPDFKKQ
jgi:hypothetical protein